MPPALRDPGGLSPEEFPELLREGRVDDPFFCDDARQELVGGHVEGGIIDPHPLRGRLDPGKMGDLLSLIHI